MSYPVGGFYLYHGDSFADRLIQWGTRSHWNHAGVIVNTRGGTVEAQSRGVVTDTLTRHDPARVRIVDTALTDAERRLVVTTAQGFLGDRYGWLSVIAAAINAVWRFPLILGTDKAPDCFVLVAHCLFHAGVDLPKDDERMTGRDLAMAFGVLPV